jgi:hypothetical protein
MPATATINSNNSSYTITDTIGGSTIKTVYPLGEAYTTYIQDVSGNKTLQLWHGGQPTIALSNNPLSPNFGNSIFGSTDPDTAQTAVQANVGAAKGGGAGAAIGDCKSGLQAGDHNGWILLNGRAKSTLTASQQTAATNLGIGVNLPNASGRAFVQGTLGATIGSSTISQSNLPNVNLSGGNHGHGIIDPGHNHGIEGNANGGTGGSQGTFTTVTPKSTWAVITSNITGISIQVSGNLSIPLGGLGAPYTPAAIGVNQFLFLGN